MRLSVLRRTAIPGTFRQLLVALLTGLVGCSCLYGQEQSIPFARPYEQAKEQRGGLLIGNRPLGEGVKPRGFVSVRGDRIQPHPMIPQPSLGHLLDGRSGHAPLQQGDYRLSGMIRRFDKLDIRGDGSRKTFIGVGVRHQAGIETVYSPVDRWTFGLRLYASKLSVLRGGSETFGLDASANFRLLPEASLYLFGGYGRTYGLGAASSLSVGQYRYGGYLSWQPTREWRLDIGIQSYGNDRSRRQWTVPIVRPSYRHNGTEIDTEFGSLFREVLKGLFFRH